MDNNRKVVITGIGPVTSLGTGREEFWSNMLNGKIIVSPIPELFEKNYTFRSRFYVPFPEVSSSDYGIPSKYSNIIEESTKLSIIGTRLALEDSGLLGGNGKINHYDPDRVQIMFGVGANSNRTLFNTYLIHTLNNRPEIIDELGMNPYINRMAVPASMPNSASSIVSILFGIHGSNFTVNTSCSSGSYAIGEAYRKIKDGYADMTITGGVECLKDRHGTIMRSFDMLRALTCSADGRPQPFSYDRSGFLFSEGGGCVVVLEELEKAKARGARIFAEMIEFEANSDAYNVVQIEPGAKQIRKLVKNTIKNYKIDYVNTHGTATDLNDKAECQIIRDIFGERESQPIINSSKGMLGHTIGASGAIEFAATALSVWDSKVHPNLAENTFENLNLAHKKTDIDIHYALSTSYGFGGHNCAIVVKKYDA